MIKIKSFTTHSVRLLCFIGLATILISCTDYGIPINIPDSSEEVDQSREIPSISIDQSPPSAYESPRFTQHIKFQKIGVDQGLSQNTVNSIAEDNLGFLWFGTWDGLNRYDGYNFTVYKYDPSDSTTISNNIIRDIFVDQGGVLWVATDNGLNRFDSKKDGFIRYQTDPENPNSLSHNFVSVIFQDQSGQLWIGTQGDGLNLFDPQTHQFIQFRNNPAVPASLSSNIIWDIAEDSSGDLWIATRTGLDLFIRQSGEFLHYRNDPRIPFSLADNDVRVIMEDQANNLWIGTYGGGLDRFDPQTEHFSHYKFDPDDATSLSGNEVRTIFSDRDGAIWVGTSSGLNQFQEDSDDFVRYDSRDYGFIDQGALSNPTILDIHQDRSGVYWIATSGGGLNYFDHSLQRFVHIYRRPDQSNTLSSNHVSAIMEDKNQVLWIGTDSGLNRYYPLSDLYTHYYHHPKDPDSLTSDSITSLLQDQDGNIWVGTQQGLNIFDPLKDQFLPYKTDPVRILRDFGELPSIDLSKLPVNAIVQDNQGLIWLGSDGEGLIRLNPAQKRVIVYPSGENSLESLYGTTILSLLEDRNGDLWVGTLRVVCLNSIPTANISPTISAIQVIHQA